MSQQLPSHLSVLIQLEALQDEVLARLEELDSRIHAVLNQYLAPRLRLVQAPAADQPFAGGEEPRDA